jgi:hypothetical protein
MSKSSSVASNNKILEGILGKMQRNAGNADELEQAQTALWSLGNEGKFSQQGFMQVITSVRDSLKRFPRHPRLQRCSLMLIFQALEPDGSDTSVACAAKIDKEGWIPGAVINAMRTHAGDIDIQLFGCGIVNELIKSPSHVDELLKVKALDAVMDALALALATPDRNFVDMALEIKTTTYAIMSKMFHVNNMKPRPVVKNLKLILESMSTHMDSPGMLMSALLAILDTCSNRLNADSFGKDGIRITFNAMRAHEDDMPVQALGCGTLGVLVHNCRDRKAYAHKLGCLEHVFRKMSMHASDSMLLTLGYTFLGHMMDLSDGSLSRMMGDATTDTSDVYRTELGELGLITTLSKALHMHVHEAEFVLLAVQNLLAFTFIKSDAHRFKFYKDGGCDAMIYVMEMYKHSVDILVTCLRAIDLTLASCLHKQAHIEGSCGHRYRLTPLVLQILSEHYNSDNGEVAHRCSCILWMCLILKEVDANSTLEAQALRYDVIGVLVCCLQTHPENEDMVVTICTLFGIAAAKLTSLQDACREAGAIDALLAVAERYKHSTKMLCIVSRNLAAITANNEKNSACVMKSMTSKQAKILGRFDYGCEAKRIMQKTASLVTECVRDLLGEDAQHVHLENYAKYWGTECKEVAKRLEVYEEETLAKMCLECGKSAKLLGVQRLTRCSGCTTRALYCSVECQKAAWPKHKAECKANRKA